MAAGLPCVVTDWNGYKDTVRHGEDGFRVPTLAPRPGYGADLAYWYANAWIDYNSYVGAAAQYTAIDLGQAEALISALVEDADLRRRLGEQAKRRAREVFDWAAIIPQYQALWAEQNARRLAAGPDASKRNDPYRPDPYTLFGNYPTRHISREDRIALVAGVSWETARPRLDGPLAIYSRFNRPTAEEVQTVLAFLADRPDAAVAEVLGQFAPGRRAFVERGLIWLARHDIVAIRPAA